MTALVVRPEGAAGLGNTCGRRIEGAASQPRKSTRRWRTDRPRRAASPWWWCTESPTSALERPRVPLPTCWSRRRPTRFPMRRSAAQGFSLAVAPLPPAVAPTRESPPTPRGISRPLFKAVVQSARSDFQRPDWQAPPTLAAARHGRAAGASRRHGAGRRRPRPRRDQLPARQVHRERRCDRGLRQHLHQA